MVRGPLGLALTNSTCARWPVPSPSANRSSPAAMMASTCCRSQSSSSLKLINPGGATSTDATNVAAGMCCSMVLAMSSGFMRATFASCSATGEA